MTKTSLTCPSSLLIKPLTTSPTHFSDHSLNCRYSHPQRPTPSRWWGWSCQHCTSWRASPSPHGHSRVGLGWTGAASTGSLLWPCSHQTAWWGWPCPLATTDTKTHPDGGQVNWTLKIWRDVMGFNLPKVSLVKDLFPPSSKSRGSLTNDGRSFYRKANMRDQWRSILLPLSKSTGSLTNKGSSSISTLKHILRILVQ